jgi:hypothetical protein
MVYSTYILYIDDAHPTGTTEEICWLASRKFAFICTFYSIKYTHRKRQPTSLTTVAWAGGYPLVRSQIIYERTLRGPRK